VASLIEPKVDVSKYNPRELGLKAGLEIHQQLDTRHKLFCSCPTVLVDEKEAKDEFVRHKVLDIIGDMYALGLPLMGEVISYCSNHRLHIEALRALYTNGILEEVEVRPVRFFVIPRKRAVRS